VAVRQRPAREGVGRDATTARSHSGEGGRKHAPQAPNGGKTLADERQNCRAHEFMASPKQFGLEERRMTLKLLGRTMARRTVWLVMVLALVLTLALSACGGRGGLGGNRNGNTGSTDSGDQRNTGGQSASVTQVTQTDDNLNAIMSALDSANQDLNLDDSGQDNETVP
jgi:hypothetical protein